MSHRPLRVQLELQEIFENPLDDPFLDEPAEDWLDKFESSAAINATFCDGRDHSAALDAELAPLDARFAGVYKKIAADAARPNDLEKSLQKLEPARSSSDELAKNYNSPQALRRACLRDYLRKSLAGGETLESIVSYARRLDPETANQLQEIGEELLG